MCDEPNKVASDNQLIVSKGTKGALSFTSYKKGSDCLISFLGELRHGSAEYLFEATVNIFELGVTNLIIDFREVSYADTIGLQNLVKLFKYVQARGNLKFCIFVSDGDLREVLRTCRFDKFINITQDESVLWDTTELA
jgi:anti-anti-sigma factor